MKAREIASLVAQGAGIYVAATLLSRVVPRPPMPSPALPTFPDIFPDLSTFGTPAGAREYARRPSIIEAQKRRSAMLLASMETASISARYPTVRPVSRGLVVGVSGQLGGTGDGTAVEVKSTRLITVRSRRAGWQ